VGVKFEEGYEIKVGKAIKKEDEKAGSE